jgi:hypothetical protein
MQRSLPVLMNRRRAHRGGVQPTAHQVGELRAGAAVGHVQDKGVGHHLQVLEGQVAGAAVAGRAVVQLAGLALGERDELLQVLHRQLGPHHVQAGHLRQQRHRHEGLGRVVGQLVEDVRVDRQRADVAEDDGVLVVRPRHLGHGDVARAARLVVDEDALAQELGHLGGGGPGHDLAAAAGRERHDQADGLAGPGGLGVGP